MPFHHPGECVRADVTVMGRGAPSAPTTLRRTTVVAVTSPTPTEVDRETNVSEKRLDVADLAFFCVFYLFLAAWLTAYLWPDPGAR